MPLTMATVGQINCIKKVLGKDEIRRHLAELGLVVGGEVTVISKIAGNMILSVKESRIAVDQTMTNRIII